LLETLNTLLRKPELRKPELRKPELRKPELRKPDPSAVGNRVLWRDSGNAPDITLQQFQHALIALRDKIASCNAQRWLLYSDDPYHFLLGFLALLGLKKKVVISASLKPEWLLGLSEAFDAILSDEPVVVPAATGIGHSLKTCFDFSQTTNTSAQWQTHLDGTEEIVFFTSGSTGQPKAVEKRLLALTNEVMTLGNTFHEKVKGRLFAASVSHMHIYGLLFKLLLPLHVKATSLKQQIEYPEQLLSLAEKISPETGIVFISSPTFLSHLDLRLAPVAMSAVFSSGGPLSFAAAQASHQYFSQLPIEVYGSTETGGIGYRQQAEATIPWTAFAGVELKMGQDGVELRSPNMPGQPAYVLDDHLEFLPNDRFLLKGRKDRIIKIAEKRISLTEIEKFLEAQPTIHQCVAMPIQGRRTVIGCAVVLSDEGAKFLENFSQAALVQGWKSAMQNRFEPVTIPRLWRVLTEIPVNSQSKIDHNQLLTAFNANQDAN
jgi:acyl-coenzyme A synthetase/AMP-(fatty) acid ligase